MIARVLAVALALALAAAGVQSWRLTAEQAEHAETRAQHAEQTAAMERAARDAVQSARTEEQRRTAAVQKVANEAQYQLDRALVDAAASADAGQRLRDHIASLSAACGGGAASHSGPAGAGTPAGTTADMLADVRRRVDEAADGIAQHADQARAAGTACQRSYDALIRR